jgi:PhnB protein
MSSQRVSSVKPDTSLAKRKFAARLVQKGTNNKLDGTAAAVYHSTAAQSPPEVPMHRAGDEFAPTAPEIFVPDVPAAVDFFTSKLGFHLVRADTPPLFAIVALEQSFVLIAADALHAGDVVKDAPRGAAIDTRIMVADVDAVYRRAVDAGVTIVHPLDDRTYGLRDFILRDPWGFRWRFASPVRR